MDLDVEEEVVQMQYSTWYLAGEVNVRRAVGMKVPIEARAPISASCLLHHVDNSLISRARVRSSLD